eukprot:7508612-Karenia_brevis.AAC.1
MSQQCRRRYNVLKHVCEMCMCRSCQDGYVDARHNHSKRGEITGFPVTFTLAVCGNTEVEIQSLPGIDNGCGGKVYEMSC